MESHGGDVELLGLEDGVAQLRLRGQLRRLPGVGRRRSSWRSRQALEEAAPDLDGIDVEGVDGAEERAAPAAAGSGTTCPRPRRRGSSLDGSSGRRRGARSAAEVAGVPLVVANVDGTLLAYRNACAGCGGAARRRPSSTAGALACPACGRSFDLPRAGRSLDDDRLQLEPVPLLRDDGPVTVALAA